MFCPPRLEDPYYLRDKEKRTPVCLSVCLLYPSWKQDSAIAHRKYAGRRKYITRRGPKSDVIVLQWSASPIEQVIAKFSTSLKLSFISSIHLLMIYFTTLSVCQHSNRNTEKKHQHRPPGQTVSRPTSETAINRKSQALQL
jgi:hypothetical protein